MACTCPEKWSKLPLILKLVPCFALAAFISCLLGFATPVWISAPDNIPVTIYQWLGGKTTLVKMDHMGIWQVCGSSDIGCIALTRDLPGKGYMIRIFRVNYIHWCAEDHRFEARFSRYLSHRSRLVGCNCFED